MGIVIVMLVLAGIVALLVWQFRQTKNAEATTKVVTTVSPARAAQIVREAFGGPRSLLWTDTGSPGSMNMRRRGVRGGITMSIDIAAAPNGGAVVSMSASEANYYLVFFANFRGRRQQP